MAIGERNHAGFTLVEVVVALVILAVGVLGAGATTLQVMRSALISDITTERVTARRAALEMLQGRPFGDVDTGADTIGRFTVEWTLMAETNQLKELAVVTLGPGSQAGAVRSQVQDTITYRIVRR